MPSEPKKPIEQMLEALAKARRAEFGDDPKMPNPMRARLHEEIARAGATEEENVESRPSWVTRFWPRVTVAAALATLIVLVPAIWWNRAHPLAEPGDLALRDRAAGAADGLNPAVGSQDTLAKAAAVSATEPTVNLADNSQIKIEPAATPASEAEASKSSTHFSQGRAATESPSQVAKDFTDKKIAARKSSRHSRLRLQPARIQKPNQTQWRESLHRSRNCHQPAASEPSSNFPNNPPFNLFGTMRR